MITVENLAYTYPHASQPAISGMDFSIAAGEVFGFLGPSGAGKSTTQHILTGLRKHYQGSAKVFGREISTWGPEYYERVGVSFELPNHFQKLTALENIRYFGALYQHPPCDPLAVLARVDLEADANTPVGQFSKGMQCRMNLARALAHEPELLFLDEPTSGLDPANVQNVYAIIRELKAAGRTVLITTHNMAIAEALCDRVAFIVGGHIALIDTPRALRLRYGQPLVRVEHGLGEPSCFPLAGLAENREFLRLVQSGQVQTIHTQEASLDQIFVQVTGHALSA